MDFMTALDIGASALSANRSYLNIISMNLANVKTTRTTDGGPYKRKSVVMASSDVDNPFSKHMQTALGRELKGVEIMDIVADQRPEKKIFEPGHPDADEEGMVSYPDINVVEEMAHMMTVQRNYEANVGTIDTVKSMYMKALEINR